MSCDLSFLCRMWLQLTCAFEPRSCRRFEHGCKRGLTTNRPRTSPTRRTGWKSASTGFTYTPDAPTGLPLFIIWAPPAPPKKGVLFLRFPAALRRALKQNSSRQIPKWMFNNKNIIYHLHTNASLGVSPGGMLEERLASRCDLHRCFSRTTERLSRQARLLMSTFVPLDVILIEQKLIIQEKRMNPPVNRQLRHENFPVCC